MDVTMKKLVGPPVCQSINAAGDLIFHRNFPQLELISETQEPSLRFLITS